MNIFKNFFNNDPEKKNKKESIGDEVIPFPNGDYVGIILYFDIIYTN